MKSVFFVAAIAIGANAAVLENRQGRQSGRPGNGGGAPAPPAATSPPDGISSHKQKREPQGPWISIGNPYQSVTIIPSNPLDLSKCGLDAFVGHTSEALLFCSSILKGGTATSTTTYTERATTTTRTTVYTTLYPPSAPSSTPVAPPPTSTPPVSTPGRPTSTSASAPAPTNTQSCGLYGYTGATAAYYFDSSGTKNNFTACSTACKADPKCKSFGYGEANCMLFDVPAGNNVAINPLSPYTFYDAGCPVELPVRKRQVQISLTQRDVSSACSCLITSGAPDATRTATTTVTSVRVTVTQTVTRTVSLLPAIRQASVTIPHH